MWTRKELKDKAKVAFKANYWPSVLAAFVISIFSAASSGSSGGKSASEKANDGSLDQTGLLLILAVVAVILLASLFLIAVKIIVGNSLIVGSQKLFLENELSEEKARVGLIGFAFKEGHWKNVTLVMFLKDLFTALWLLLFVVPGIIKAYEYRMIPYILAENPEMSRAEVFAKSKEMMNGEKWKSFVLDLSFIGWHLLALLTCGILTVFYVAPYVSQTGAELYITLKNKAE